VSIRVEVGWLCREQHGRRPVEFNTRSFVARGPVPQEGGGLGRARTSRSEGVYGTKVPMKRRRAWRRRWSRKSDFASFWLNYTCHSTGMSETTKSIKFTICQVLTTYTEANTEANSLQLVAHSMLHMRHQSFNPLTHDLFL